MFSVSSLVDGSTIIFWNLRPRLGSLSNVFLYPLKSAVPITWISPPSRAWLSMAARPKSSWPFFALRVESMLSITRRYCGFPASAASRSFTRSSNIPLSVVPLIRAVMFKDRICFP